MRGRSGDLGDRPIGPWWPGASDAMIGAMAGPSTPQTSSAGWDALRSADWPAARAAFESELADTETAAALDGLARARWWLSDIPGAIEAWGRAYTAYPKAGLDEPAGHVAILLSREHAEGLGNDALANGWLARARDLLGGQPDSIEWGWVGAGRVGASRRPDTRTRTCRAGARRRAERP
jgi:hypothetical protein